LQFYLSDPRVPIDNNESEQLMKQIALGRNYAESKIMRSSIVLLDHRFEFQAVWRLSFDGEVSIKKLLSSSFNSWKGEQPCWKNIFDVHGFVSGFGRIPLPSRFSSSLSFLTSGDIHFSRFSFMGKRLSISEGGLSNRGT
jgi:hypothetical protein